MVKVAIVGSGFGLYGLLPAFNSLKNCQVVSICGKKTERLAKYCQKIGLTKIYTNWQEMLDKEKLDALALAVIPSAQYEICKVAIRKGLHIFAEKPLAANYIQAKHLLKLVTEKKIIQTIDFLYLEINIWKKAKSLIDSKIFGKLNYVYVNWDFPTPGNKKFRPAWKSNTKEGGGALSYYFSHALYYLEYFCGEISNFKSNIYFVKRNLKKEEVGVDLILKFKNSINGYAHLSCDGIVNRHHLMFQFERGILILENENNSVTNFSIKIYAKGKFKKISQFEEKIKEGEDERVRFVKKIAHRFIKSCMSNESFNPTFRDGARVQYLIDKIRLNS